jgi:hypothetical protein
MMTTAAGGQSDSCSISSIGGLDPPNQSFFALGGPIKSAHGGIWVQLTILRSSLTRA